MKRYYYAFFFTVFSSKIAVIIIYLIIYHLLFENLAKIQLKKLLTEFRIFFSERSYERLVSFMRIL